MPRASLRGSDDYLTARAANPTTGLITPFTPAPLFDHGDANAASTRSTLSFPHLEHTGRILPKAAAPRSPDLEFDLGANVKGKHARGLSGPKWLDRLRLQGVGQQNQMPLHGPGVKLGGVVASQRDTTARDELTGQSRPWHLGCSASPRVMEHDAVGDEYCASTRAGRSEEDLLSFFKVPRRVRRSTSPEQQQQQSDIGAGASSTQKDAIPLPRAVQHHAENRSTPAMPKHHSPAETTPATTTENRGASLPVLTTALHLTPPTSPGPATMPAKHRNRRLPYPSSDRGSLDDTSETYSVRRKPLHSPLTPQPHRPGQEQGHVRPQPRPLQQASCGIDKDVSGKPFTAMANDLSRALTLRRLPSVRLLPPQMAGIPRNRGPEQRRRSLDEYYDLQTPPGVEGQKVATSDRTTTSSAAFPVAELLTSFLALLQIFQPTSLEAIKPLFDVHAEPELRLRALRLAIAGAGRVLIGICAVLFVWRVVGIVVEVVAWLSVPVRVVLRVLAWVLA